MKGAALRVLDAEDLSILWSETEWPLPPDSIQQSAVEFHQVISHVFAQAAVIPFRLLTVFDHEESLASFAAAQARNFVADLERLKNTVQMECVIFFKPVRGPDRSSGQAYLQQKANVQRTIDDYVSAVKASLSGVAREIRAKEVNNGSRIYCLLERGQEALFRSTVEGVVVPEGLERRLSGPWPPAEFLSDAVKMPRTHHGDTEAQRQTEKN